MPYIISQPLSHTHINKIGYLLVGVPGSDTDTIRRLGYRLYDVDTGEEIIPLRSFDALGKGKFHEIEFQRQLRELIKTDAPLLLTPNPYTNHPAFSKKIRLDTYTIEISNLGECLRTIIPDETGNEIIVINGVLGYDEEEFIRIGNEISFLTNKFPLDENKHVICKDGRDWVHVYARTATSFTANWVIYQEEINGDITELPFTQSYNLAEGMTAIDLRPSAFGVNHDNPKFYLRFGKSNIHIVQDDCCEGKDLELFGLHPWGGYDNLNMERVDSTRLEKLNEVVKLNTFARTQTEFANINDTNGYISINHENKEQIVFIRHMENTIENRRWGKYIMSAKKYIVLDTIEDGTKVWRAFIVSATVFGISKEDDEIVLSITGYFNQSIPVQ